MADIFVKPSAVIDRLRTQRDLFAAAVGGGWIPFEVYGGTQDYIEESAKHDTPIAIYVTTGSSTGAVQTLNGIAPTDITYGMDIIMIFRTEDEIGQHADEFSVFMREFLVKALHGWEPISGCNPFTYANDVPAIVQGHAIYIRIFTFQQQIEITRSDLDGALGSWDDLDDFLELFATINASAPDNDDTATLESLVTVAGP